MTNPPRPCLIHGVLCISVIDSICGKDIVANVVAVHEWGTTPTTRGKLIDEASKFIGKTLEEWCTL